MPNYDHLTVSSLDALVEALEARDAYTAGHGLRVAKYARAIGEALGLTPSQAHGLYLAAHLHDVGKIGIPDSILLKPASLTEAETALVRTHTQIGRRILARIQEFGPLLAVAELHHENFDGSGYPFGLAGERIPLVARIVRVADAYDAMTTDRVYRAAFNPVSAHEYICSAAGKLFDPGVVAAFDSVIQAGVISDSLSALAALCAATEPRHDNGVSKDTHESPTFSS